jgi:multidrug transporter EmrE-like cation transporter
MIYNILLFLSIVLNVVAQTILKYGGTTQDVIQVKSNFFEKIVAAINPFFIIAALFYGASFLAYSVVLSKMEISQAYPVAVVSAVVLILLISIFFFHENISMLRASGIFLCILGVILIFLK